MKACLSLDAAYSSPPSFVTRSSSEAHQESVRTKQHTRQIVYWPGIIDNIILRCKQCQDNLPSHPREPIISKPRPYQELAIDFCTYGGHQFLVIIDCCTDWPDVIHMGKNTTTSHLNAALLDVFCRTGAPDVIWSDQGPQFTSQRFQVFQRVGISSHHIITHLPTEQRESRSRGMKKIIAGAWTHHHLDKEQLARSMLHYRNTPSRRDGLSPAQKLFGKAIQDTLPAHRRAFAPQWQKASEEVDKSTDITTEEYYNQHAHPLPHWHQCCYSQQSDGTYMV